MNKMKAVISAFIFLCTLQASATEMWIKNAVQVPDGSRMQRQIDDAYLAIFRGPNMQQVCSVFPSNSDLMWGLGVSESTAATISGLCGNGNPNGVTTPGKAFRKKFFVSFNGPAGLDSWTDYANRTYIFADSSLTRAKLKSVLLHEMAMSFDFKSRLYYIIYATTVQSYGHELTGDSEQIEASLNALNWKPLAQTFAAMRAFNLERLNQGQNIWTLTHQFCQSEFQNLFYQIKKLPANDPTQQDSSDSRDSFQKELAEIASRNFTPKSSEEERALINKLLDATFKMSDFSGKSLTFCQFMSRPVLTNTVEYTFLSSGPRPRLTGGSGGQGLEAPNTEKEKSLAEALSELRTDRVKNSDSIGASTSRSE